jgi:hypothetical protein
MQGCQSLVAAGGQARSVDAAVKGCCEVAKSQTPLVGVAVPAPWGMLAMLGQIIVTLTSAGSTSQVLHVVTFVKLIYRNGARPAKAHRFQNGAKQVTEKSHEADESDNSCYWSLDVCVCGAALLRLL